MKRFELIHCHAGLLSSDILHVPAEDTDELRQVVDISARTDAAEHAPLLDGFALFVVEVELGAVGVFVFQELFTVGRAVKGVATSC